MLSGIGDPAVMTPLGIKTLVNSPQVGKNLQVQLTPIGTTSFKVADISIRTT